MAPVKLLLVMLVCGCSRNAAFPDDGPAPAGPEPLQPTPEPTTAASPSDRLPSGASRHSGVSTYSSLPALFSGQVGPRLRLSDLPTREPLVGVGSLSDLRGEIVIVDGECWVSYPDGSAARQTNDEHAAFLAVARVDTWHELTLERAIDWQALPEELAQQGQKRGLAQNEPMAIHIEGRAENVEYNVVNGPALGIGEGAPRPVSKDELSQTAMKRSLPDAQVRITGFYARENGEAFIHPGKTMHLHVLFPDSKQMGHLDRATLIEGASVKLGRPVSEREQPVVGNAEPRGEDW